MVSFINTPATRPSSACPTTGIRKPKAKKVVDYPTVNYDIDANGNDTASL